MASKKKESEGIALLSMYNDEDEDGYEEDVEEREDLGQFASDSANETTYFLLQSQSSIPIEDSTPKEDRVLAPQPQFSLSPPPPPPPPPPPVSDAQRVKKRALAIVDYAHDETAMSPETEEGEIMGTGHVMFGADLQTANGNFLGKTPPGTVQILTPKIEATPPQPSDQPEPSQSDNSTTMNHIKIETETDVIEETTIVSVEIQKDVDPLENFLPPPPKNMCSMELQEKINKFLALKKAGKSYNAEVRNRKDYRNPDFLLHAVRYQDIDQIGSCFSKDVFDPHGYDKSDYYDEIEADMKREEKRRDQEMKKNQKLEFVSGGTQPGCVAAAQKISMQIPVVPTVASSGFHSLPTSADAMSRDNRQGKKSKWDKVDGDRKNPMLIGGQDGIPTAAMHTTLLSAANVGTGYNAFAQKMRREAEERRSNEKRRS